MQHNRKQPLAEAGQTSTVMKFLKFKFFDFKTL